MISIKCYNVNRAFIRDNSDNTFFLIKTSTTIAAKLHIPSCHWYLKNIPEESMNQVSFAPMCAVVYITSFLLLGPSSAILPLC